MCMCRTLNAVPCRPPTSAASAAAAAAVAPPLSLTQLRSPAQTVPSSQFTITLMDDQVMFQDTVSCSLGAHFTVAPCKFVIEIVRLPPISSQQEFSVGTRERRGYSGVTAALLHSHPSFMNIHGILDIVREGLMFTTKPHCCLPFEMLSQRVLVA